MILRIQYKKIGNMKFLSHLDMVRLVERGLRRASLPLKFSQGFNPHPRISFAAPLSVGVSSDYELVDIELTETIDLESLQSEFNKHFPTGIQFVRGRFIEKSNSLMSMVSDCSYAVTLVTEPGLAPTFAKVTEIMMDKAEIKSMKRGKDKKMKEVDIRPLIKELSVLEVQEDQVTLRIKVAAGSNGSVKPEAIITAIEEAGEVKCIADQTRVHRVMLYGEEGKTELYVLE